MAPGSVGRRTPQTPQIPQRDDGLALPYEAGVLANTSTPVTVPPPQAPPADVIPVLLISAADADDRDVSKRDSGLAPTESIGVREGSTTSGDEASSTTLPNGARVSQTTASLYETKSNSSSTRSLWKLGGAARGSRPKTPRTPKTPKTPPSTGSKQTTSGNGFSPIATPIPSDSQLELDFMDQISFSKRGSVLLGGRKVANGRLCENTGRREPEFSAPTSPKRLLSEEMEKESLKVRAMYESGQSPDWIKGKHSTLGDCFIEEEAVEDYDLLNGSREALASRSSFYSDSVFTTRRLSTVRSEHELAGGIEDWEDVNGSDIDRYGFITTRRETAPRSSTPEAKSQRPSTALQPVSEMPRKRRGFGRTLSSSKSFRSAPHRSGSRKRPTGSVKTQTTSSSRLGPKPFRSAANRLPGNRDRRWVDEAGDMLTLPPGLAEIAEDEEGGKAAEEVKKKEWNRTEKWRKMAKVVKDGTHGEGMQFEFDVRNPKLIERTWKGIPDCWRATAWYSFLSVSAKKKLGAATDDEIIQVFHELQQQSSADDLQIDMDVPRTISSHIMFRKRYRGGQRLLFRVLHALSLYFLETGYVQGMASLAATLLCYYDEERTFIMLVRMWELRGLQKLYESGFAGLMAALDEFQKEWMDRHDVSKKLEELGIEPTAYGTRWYLTLFNYSIPFAAQLRVWDVFMLLGDTDMQVSATKERPFGGCLDVLHAASAALIDGTRDIFLDSDFENAMKALTSWIPVKDEELFMKVTKAEWKMHRGRRRG